MDKGDLDSAGDALQSQIRLASNMANPYDSMGDYYLAVGDDESALKYFNQSARMGLNASTIKADSLNAQSEKEDE